MDNLYVTLILLFCGLAVHFLKDIIRIKKESGAPVEMKKYWTENKYQTLFCVVSAIAGFFGLYETGQLTGLTAFGVGYMSNSVADVLGKRGTDRLA